MGYHLDLNMCVRFSFKKCLMFSTFPVKDTFISGRELAKQAKQKFNNNETIVHKIQECKKRTYEVGEKETEAEVKRSK